MLVQIAKVVWAAPCSAVGLVLGAAVLLLGGKARHSFGTLEFAFRDSEGSCGRLAQSLPFRAITFGHVIIAISEQELDRSHEHELVHVRQYERWGLAFFVAYPTSSIWQLLKGRNAYLDNYFEVQARSLSSERPATERDACSV
jgi:hypothetical protein